MLPACATVRNAYCASILLDLIIKNSDCGGEDLQNFVR